MVAELGLSAVLSSPGAADHSACFPCLSIPFREARGPFVMSPVNPWCPWRPGLREMLSQYLCKERRTEVLSLLPLAVTADLPSGRAAGAAHFPLGVPVAVW